jgi:hypothetical protein
MERAVDKKRREPRYHTGPDFHESLPRMTDILDYTDAEDRSTQAHMVTLHGESLPSSIQDPSVVKAREPHDGFGGPRRSHRSHSV